MNWKCFGRKWSWPNFNVLSQYSLRLSKIRKPSVRIAGIPVEIWTREILNTKHSTTTFSFGMLKHMKRLSVSTRLHGTIFQKSHLHTRRRENLKSHTFNKKCGTSANYWVLSQGSIFTMWWLHRFSLFHAVPPSPGWNRAGCALWENSAGDSVLCCCFS
jgi:hypothetical protein